jgi:hypothetical protein
MTQPLPVLCSVSVRGPLAGTWSPTAQQSLAVLQLTSVKKSPPGAWGLMTTVQLMPSKCSVKVRSCDVLSRYLPTAQQLSAVMQVRLDRKSPRLPLALGLLTTTQPLPLLCSISVSALALTVS